MDVASRLSTFSYNEMIFIKSSTTTIELSIYKITSFLCYRGAELKWQQSQSRKAQSSLLAFCSSLRTSQERRIPSSLCILVAALRSKQRACTQRSSPSKSLSQSVTTPHNKMKAEKSLISLRIPPRESAMSLL